MSNHASRPIVWITDDSPVEARITERALGPGYEFEYFADGSLVLERLAKPGRLPDLLLLDWVMPGVSGDEVCRFLRAQPHTVDLPIILVTASRVETDDIVQGLSFGANDYIARPFVDAELRARVDTAIRAKRLRELAARERNRLAVINRLGRAFVDVGPRLESVLEVLAESLIEGVCDGCAIATAPGVLPGTVIARHRSPDAAPLLATFGPTDPCTHAFSSNDDARARLPVAYHPAIERFGISALAVVPFPPRSPVTGIITVTRDRGGIPFEPEDLVTIETCLEYAAMAFEKALRFDAERALRMQLETILEHMPISIVVADTSGAITHINQTALGVLPILQNARTISDVHQRMGMLDGDGNAIESARSPLNRALRGEASRGAELEVTIGGEHRYVRASAVSLTNVQGVITAAILAFDDVTAEKLVAAEREQAIEFQRYVLGIVSHDLRSPLQTLTMGCEGIRMFASDNPKVIQFVQRMESTAHRMKGIIEQLLDVVRTQLGGGIPMTPAELDLADVVTSVLGEISLANPATRFESRIERVRGSWDRDRLGQIVTNLVNNAIQHGEKGSPVYVDTSIEGEHAVLRVRNRSVRPLTDEQMATIFAPFRRAKEPTGGTGGLGLGLYIVNEIVRAHDGDIRVESDSTTTTFIVRLPLQLRPASL